MIDIYFVRHGATIEDEEDLSSGWTDIGLNRNGVAAIHGTAQWLAQNVEAGYLVSSDLTRAMESARIIGKRLGLKPRPAYNLRDWNTGELAGQKSAIVHARLKYLIKHPEVPAPGGEPFEEYRDRLATMISALLPFARKEPKAVIAVTHSRVVYTLPYIFSGDKRPIPMSGPPNPGGVVCVTERAGKPSIELVYNPTISQ